MILDAVIFVILVMMIAAGRRKGLVYILFNMLSWIVGIAAGLILALPLSAFLSEAFAESISCAAGFFAAVLIVRFLIKLFVKPAAARRGSGLFTAADRILGMAAGGLNGLLIIFLLLTLLVPVLHMTGTEAAQWTASRLEESVIAGTLYDNNIILLIAAGLIR